ncbi:helix-turn-helix domain-containing protein [Streptomyces sp. NBC_00378]|uniref:IclR family transcriptional regulator domain-containing protein n=1 Tax=unclassified Streptomyces TaxID=2593676 RepID=UPI0022522E1A|nr:MULTISPECIES: IclR family transcriptional regulator C-terminal domain-containing protein [unclassified Streptomyces]MCX5107437.1 helix-turn-helix domain-containing protein [Streptomyces sp. NBC_00378]
MAQPTGPAASPDELVGPLERGLTVLRAIAAGPETRHRPGDLARTTGLARSTVDRVATTLVRLGFLRTEGRDLLLAPRSAELGNAYLAAAGLSEALGPHAVTLADELDESVSVAVPDGDGVRFIAQATRRRAMAISFRTGDLLPAERCAPGALFAVGWDEAEWERWRSRRREDPLDHGFPAVPPRAGGEGGESGFLARTDRAREDGRAVDDQLIEPGLLAVALPVRDAAGAVVCAVSVVSHTSRHDTASLLALALPPLRAAVVAMERALAAPAPPPDGTALSAIRGDAGVGALKEELGAGFLQSLARGLDVLCAFGAVRGPVRLTELARLAGLPRATARRALITLRHLGYVREDAGSFQLRPRVLELGHARLSGLSLAEIAGPHLAELVGRVHESASVAVLDRNDIRYVARVASSRIMHIDITVGTRLPAYATSMGRVLLGALAEEERAPLLAGVTPEAFTSRTVIAPEALAEAVAETARRGYGWVEQELEEGLRSLAAPVTDGRGRVVAAVNVALHAGRCPAEQSLAELLPHVMETAARISADLAAVGRWSPVPLA